MRVALLALIICLPLAGFAAQDRAPFTGAEKRQIVAAIAAAPTHGLPALAVSAADDDARLTEAVLRYASLQSGARATPRRVDELWGVTPEPSPDRVSLEAARADGRLQAWLDALPPPDAEYRLLVRQRQRYAAYAMAGSWPLVPTGAALKSGDTDPRVAILRRRLHLEGYGSSDTVDPALFDGTLASALARYQVARYIEVDGILGPESLAALNVTPAQRLAQIDANLERWRWLPRRLPAERIEVDVAAAEAIYFVADRPSLRMNVVVGNGQHHTPLFYSAVASIVFNPPWNVPASIARKEILPRAARDPDYLRRNNFRYVGGQLQQAPGPGSALGLVKFDFPSPYGVYLHDTPGKAAFAQRRRTLSHGCVRLEKPRELAVLLLARQGWAPGRVEAVIAAGDTQRVTLDQAVPLFLVYRTALGLGDGSVVFRPDVYGWDAKLNAALAAHPTRVARATSMDSECQAGG